MYIFELRGVRHTTRRSNWIEKCCGLVSGSNDLFSRNSPLWLLSGDVPAYLNILSEAGHLMAGCALGRRYLDGSECVSIAALGKPYPGRRSMGLRRAYAGRSQDRGV